jgi:FkbM family methyltransferase
VSIWLNESRHVFKDTQATLRQLGCVRVNSACTLYWRFAESLLPDYSRDLPHKVYEDREHVLQAADLWADDRSRAEYLSHIRWRALGDLGGLCSPVSEAQYFVYSLYTRRLDEVFVDCGAYIGDTIQKFIDRNHQFDHIYAIEADRSNYARMLKSLDVLDDGVRMRITSVNAALSDRKGKIRFEASGSAAARVSDSGDCVVDTCALDDIGFPATPTLVKMDIEGAELEALCGAKQVLSCDPVLAICSYHRQSDLWRVPLLIRSLNSSYKLFLRSHEADGWEVVCYAVPPKRVVN